jgi:energy-coupling factor transporter ATP-binding protein EcfA2
VHIEKLHLDRFGVFHNLQLDSLTNGLNVFYGPAGSGKSTLVHFLRAMLHGFESDIRRRFLSPGSRGFGGSLSVATDGGKLTLSRYDDGSTQGRLTVVHPDGRVLGHRDLGDVLAGVSSTTWDRVFALDFQQRPSLRELLQTIRSQYPGGPDDGVSQTLSDLRHELKSQQAQLSELPSPESSLEDLQRKRTILIDEIQILQAQQGSELAEVRARRSELAAERSDIQRHLERVREQLHATTQAIEELRQQRQRLLEQKPRQPSAALSEPQELELRLQQIETQLERWRNVMRELTDRRQQLQHDADDHPTDAAMPAIVSGDPRSYLRGLQTQLGRLQVLVSSTRSAPGDACRCQQLNESLPPILDAMLENVNRICRELNHRESDALIRESSSEAKQLARCEAELQMAIRGLIERRRVLRQKLAECLEDVPLLPEWQRDLCGCADHPRITPASVDLVQPENETAIQRIDDELERLSRRKEKLANDENELQTELDELQQRLDQLDADQRKEAWERIASKRGRLQQVERELETAQLKQRILRRIAELEKEIRAHARETWDPQILRDAAAYLRRISAGNLTAIRIASESDVYVLDEHRVSHDYVDITRGQRNLVYLALCLALIRAGQRQGTYMPLILDGVFTHLDSKIVPETAELLRDFAHGGQQIIVLTRYEHVASVFRVLNASVRDVPPLSPHGIAPQPEVFPRPVAAHRTALAEDERRRTRLWDAEEFPGELIDRTRVAGDAAAPQSMMETVQATEYLGQHSQRAASTEAPRQLVDEKPETPQDYHPGHYVSERHSIDEADWIDRSNIERLRKIGILRIGDLLRVAPAEVVTELRYAGITAEMIATWQAQARLVCHVPRLRPYDARILVACGITSPDQLRGYLPSELREVVRRFAASSEGQAVLLSGTEYELSRVTDWIKAAEHVQWTGRQRAGGEEKTSRSTSVASDSSSSRRTTSSARKRSTGKQAADETKTPTHVVPMPRKADTEWRFYLDRSSAVVDAPSIGPRTAEHLEKAGIKTVHELLQADVEALAEKLKHARIRAEKIRQWQSQTELACRVPQLRGHDAQILVALEINTPEQLAHCDPSELWDQVRPFIDSKEGKRIIRNGKEPDLEEVSQWIEWATAARALHAA